MGESNQEWGALAEHDTELAGVWDRCERLPDPGEHTVLDAFCESKRLTIESLVRIGTRLADPNVLAWAYSGGVKFRDMLTGRRWSTLGGDWLMKHVPGHETADEQWAIVAEGETDAARLTILYPTLDVFVLPAGARRFTQEHAAQLAEYPVVLAGLDADEAGEAGAAKIAELVPQAVRFAPPANDWCATEEAPPLEVERPVVLETLVAAGELMELEVPEQASWFENELLPIGGLMMLHGWAKSFKSFMALDLLASLAQGQDWCCFEPMEEPCRVAVVQFEITWPYYRQRIEILRHHAREPELLDQNLLTWTPMRRPQLAAGNSQQEDHMLSELLRAGVQVLLLDPVRRATGSIDMNAEGEVRKMLAFFERLNDEGITVVTTHHDNKDGARSGGGNPLSMTGSGAWSGDPDTLVSVSLPKGDQLNSSTRRNLFFTLRNAPITDPRGMRIETDGQITYTKAPHGDWNEDPNEGSAEPSI